MTTAVEEKIHGLNPIPFQIEQANSQLSNLNGELEQAETQRKEILRLGIVGPREELKLKGVEQQIESLRLKISRMDVKIESLEEDLPTVDIEVRTAAGNLETAKERMPEVLAELKQVDAEAEALCDDKVVKRLVTMMKKRTDLVDELQSTLPNQIMGAEGYLHLAPTREFSKALARPEKVQNLADGLK